jgi:hypothetical protein
MNTKLSTCDDKGVFTNGVYYESMKRKVFKPIYECRCNGRLQTKRFTRLSYTGSVVELEHLKIKARLTNEKFASVKGECEILVSVRSVRLWKFFFFWEREASFFFFRHFLIDHFLFSFFSAFI